MLPLAHAADIGDSHRKQQRLFDPGCRVSASSGKPDDKIYLKYGIFLKEAVAGSAGCSNIIEKRRRNVPVRWVFM